MNVILGFQSAKIYLLQGVLIIVLALAPIGLKAQEKNDSLKVELAPIEVTAIHTTVSAANAPLSLSTINRDSKTINSSPSLSLQSIGNQLPGLWVNDRQNYALGERLTIRGIGWRAAFGVRGIQVVLNGIPLTVADGQSMINVIDPAFIRHAELVRGPAATYWGNSSGGVLYLSSRPPHQNRQNKLRLRTMAGSFGMRKEEAEYSLSNPNHQMDIYSSYLRTDGFRDYSSAKLLRSGITGSVKLTSKSRLKYQAGMIYMPKAQHPSSLTKQQAQDNPTLAIPSFVSSGAGKNITQGQAGLSYILDTSAGVLNVTGYGINRDLNNPLPFGIITLNRWAGGLRATLDKSWHNFDLQVGAETKLQNDDRTEFDNIGSPERGNITVDQIERVWNEAVFATGTFTIGSFNILGGLRYDRLRFSTDASVTDESGARSFGAFSPSVGINYNKGSQTIYANLSTSFEAPTTTELVNRPGGGNGFNPNLGPEHTVGLEIGTRGSNPTKNLSYDLSVYRMWIRDLLFPYQLQTNGPTYYRNQGETNHTGVEGKLSWQVTHDWKVTTVANFIHAEFKKAETLDSLSLAGKNVPGIPKFRFNGKISWSPGSFLGSISYKYVSNYAVNNLNTQNNDRYGIWDADISYQLHLREASIQLQPFISVKNLLNSRYNDSVVINSSGGRYYEPAPGRNLQIGISVDL
ncbi:MAG TPA: TonB-dependent receptor [Balneolaceae bacterium]|nr:TonB-dependent receptor [Balneolaceae bacterium]